jgi:hypothetical protein
MIMNSTTISVHEALGTDLLIDLEEDFVNGVYASVDKAAAGELARLRGRAGIIPTCRLGCNHCCHHHILTSSLEAHKIAQHIKREFSEQQIMDLKKRTQQWHAWDRRMEGRYPSEDMDTEIDLSNYEHCCPLNVDGACSAYQARPVVCRVHYVSSPVVSCLALKDRTLPQIPPVKMTSIETTTQPFSKAVKDRIESSGMDFTRAVMLLPHWLATEMGWDFQ